MKPKELHHLRCNFTEEELKEFSKTLAREAEDQQRAEQEKKVAMAQCAERIARHQATVGQMARNINNGYEMRMVECTIELDTPEKGRARIIRNDTGEVVRERPMTECERQLGLPLDQKTEALS